MAWWWILQAPMSRGTFVINQAFLNSGFTLHWPLHTRFHAGQSLFTGISWISWRPALVDLEPRQPCLKDYSTKSIQLVKKKKCFPSTNFFVMWCERKKKCFQKDQMCHRRIRKFRWSKLFVNLGQNISLHNSHFQKHTNISHFARNF